jgi:hypothetical protein
MEAFFYFSKIGDSFPYLTLLKLRKRNNQTDFLPAGKSSISINTGRFRAVINTFHG